MYQSMWKLKNSKVHTDLATRWTESNKHDHSLAAQTEVNWICVPTLQVVWTIGCAEWQSQSWQLAHNEQHSQHSRNVKVVSLYPILSYPIPTHPITGVKWNIACLQSNWVKMGPSPDQCHWIRHYLADRIYRTTQWRRKKTSEHVYEVVFLSV